jgi:hypothetical protein
MTQFLVPKTARVLHQTFKVHFVFIRFFIRVRGHIRRRPTLKFSRQMRINTFSAYEDEYIKSWVIVNVVSIWQISRTEQAYYMSPWYGYTPVTRRGSDCRIRIKIYLFQQYLASTWQEQVSRCHVLTSTMLAAIQLTTATRIEICQLQAHSTGAEWTVILCIDQMEIN